jgi:hypothetical protein
VASYSRRIGSGWASVCGARVRTASPARASSAYWPHTDRRECWGSFGRWSGSGASPRPGSAAAVQVLVVTGCQRTAALRGRLGVLLIITQ